MATANKLQCVSNGDEGTCHSLQQWVNDVFLIVFDNTAALWYRRVSYIRI